MASAPLSPRESAILAELGQLQTAPQPTVTAPAPSTEPVVSTAQPVTRQDAILGELSQLTNGMPNSKGEAVLRELSTIQRRQSDVISGNSFVERTLDVLNTPQQFLFGMLTREPTEDLIQAGVRGTRENTRFADVLERDFGANPNRIDTKILGFIGDLTLDPLLFLPIGKVTKLGAKGIAELGKLGASAAEKIAPEVSARIFESAIKPVAQAFSKTVFRSKVERDLITEIDFAIGRAQVAAKKIMVEEAEARKIAVDVAQRYGISESEALADVARRVEAKTRAQTAFPFATPQQSQEILQSPQLDLWGDLKKDLTREFNHADDAVRQAAADAGARYPDAFEREAAAQAVSLKQELENILVRERAAGMTTRDLYDMNLDYLTHAVTPEAKKELVKLPATAYRNLGREYNATHGFQLARELDAENNPAIRRIVEQGITPDIATLNTLWREGKLLPELGTHTTDLFISDPYVLAAIRRIRGERTIADAEILLKSATNPEMALPKASAPAHWRPLNLPPDARWDRLRSYLKRYHYDPEIAAHLESTLQQSLLPEGLSNALKTFDTAQNIWKQLTLHVFPSYHARNFVGNVWNNSLAGLNNPKWYAEAAKLQTGAAKEFTLAGRTYSLEKLRTMAEDFGVTSGTFAEAETFRKSLPGMAGRVFFSAEDVPVLGKAVSAGQKVGTIIENNSRLALFMHQLEQGKTPLEAALTTKKYLFDYARGLTAFEQSVMRRVMPFYAWTRFNLPLQLSALVNNPRPFIRLSDLVNTVRTKGIAGSKDFEQQSAAYRGEDAPMLAEFIKHNVGIPYRIGPNGEPEFFLMQNWLPAGDLEALGKGGFYDKLKDLLSPFLKTPIEQLANRDLFTGRELEQYPGETKRLVGVEMRRRYAQLVRNVRLLSEADRILTAWSRDNELEPDQQSKLSAITRLLFGLKGYEAQPQVETRRIHREQQETRRFLKSAIQNDLPDAAELLSGQRAGNEE